MIGGLAAEVLGEAARIADRPAPIEEALARIDPVLRGVVRRRALGAFADALVALGALRATPAEQLRLAARIAATGPVSGSSEELERILAATPPMPRRRWWWLTGIALVLALVGGTLVGRGVYRAYVARRPDALHRAGPRPGGAWAVGGRPPLAPPVVDVFARALPDWAIALSAAGRSGGTSPAATTAREELLARARADLPAEVAARLSELVAAGEGIASAAPETLADRPDTDTFLVAVGRLDDALAAAGLGVWVDGDVLVSDARVLVIVYAFAVDEVRRFRGGALEVAALRLRRLDPLSVRHALIGFTRPNLREAVVLLDQLDGLVAGTALPALGDGAPLRLCGAPSDDDPPGRAPLELGYGALARQDLAAAGVPPEVGARVATLLARRAAVFTRVKATLARGGLVLADPDGLTISPTLLDELEGRVARAELDELAEVDHALAGEEAGRLHAQVRAALAASVERHEVQHRLDLGTGTLPMPAALEAVVGPASTPDGTERGGAGQARDELSAYTAEVARDAVTSRLGLAMVGRFLCDPALWGTAESNAAVVLLEGLGRELGIASPPLAPDGRVDREATIALLVGLGAAPPASVRAAAARLWERWYGRPLPALAQVAGPPP